MMRLRRIAQSVLCCLLCLTVCAVPALAGKLDTVSGVFLSEENTFMVNTESQFGEPDSPWNSMPASFSFADGVYTYEWSDVEQNIYGIETRAGKVFEVIVNVGNGDGYVDVEFSNFQAFPLIRNGFDYGYFKMNGKVDFLVDNQLVASQTVTNSSMPPITNWSGAVNRYFSVRYTFTSTAENPVQFRGYTPLMRVILSDFTVNNQVTVLDEIQVTVNNIQGLVTSTKNVVIAIEQDVFEIKDGLQDSNSGIWQSFKDSVSGLFVPSSRDLEVVKNGFDQLAQEKLGGAYQTVELVDNGVQSVVDKFKNPGSSPGVEFPGISVPLGGDVGTVTLAASQTVTIPEQITSVLYPVAGVIIPIVCVIWTIRQCTDMVECFMSGMSYAEFLHRNSDEEDEEV